MVLEQDFPMTPVQKRVLAIGFGVWLVIGVALFGGFLPGLKPSLSNTGIATIDGHPYHVIYSTVHGPLLGNHSAPWNVSFYNVSFTLWTTNWYSTSGGVLHGVGTEPNGTSYPFELGELATNGSRSTFFLAPDGEFAVGWAGGWFGGVFAVLYVRA